MNSHTTCNHITNTCIPQTLSRQPHTLQLLCIQIDNRHTSHLLLAASPHYTSSFLSLLVLHIGQLFVSLWPLLLAALTLALYTALNTC